MLRAESAKYFNKISEVRNRKYEELHHTQPAAARIIHMWGTQKPQGTYPSKRRFISTYCGKNDYFRAVATVLRSPSPRVWGTRFMPGDRRLRMRLIPTYAGNTISLVFTRRPAWAHPHVCGEHLKDPDPLCGREGSSPRMRGTLPFFLGGACPAGLIPTYAGNTL